MGPGGSDGHFGAVKVIPLSIPASRGSASTVTVSTQLPPTHKLKLSTPTNQSGEGTNRVTIDTREWLPSTKNSVSVRPVLDGIAGALNSSNIPSAPWLCSSRESDFPVSANDFSAAFANWPSRKRVNDVLCDRPVKQEKNEIILRVKTCNLWPWSLYVQGQRCRVLSWI